MVIKVERSREHEDLASERSLVLAVGISEMHSSGKGDRRYAAVSSV